MIPLKSAYAYNGWSGRSGTRIARPNFTRFARESDYRLIGFFQESSPEDQRGRLIGPRFVELLQALPLREANIVVVSSLAAISEDNLIQDLIVWALKRRGFAVIPINRNRHLPMGYSENDTSQLFDILNQFDTEVRLLRANQAREKFRAEKGKLEGRKAYGSYEGEQQVIERMTQLRKEGLSFAAIAETLQREGVHPRGSRLNKPVAWQARTVNRILARQR